MAENIIISFSQIKVNVLRKRETMKGKFDESEKKLVQAMTSVQNVLAQGGWKSVKELGEMKIAGDRNLREALRLLVKRSLVLSMTRNQAEDKKIIPIGGGKTNEVLYSINTESAFAVELDEFKS